MNNDTTRKCSQARKLVLAAEEALGRTIQAAGLTLVRPLEFSRGTPARMTELAGAVRLLVSLVPLSSPAGRAAGTLEAVLAALEEGDLESGRAWLDQAVRHIRPDPNLNCKAEREQAAGYFDTFGQGA